MHSISFPVHVLGGFYSCARACLIYKWNTVGESENVCRVVCTTHAAVYNTDLYLERVAPINSWPARHRTYEFGAGVFFFQASLELFLTNRRQAIKRRPLYFHLLHRIKKLFYLFTCQGLWFCAWVNFCKLAHLFRTC